jgi:hypothetical protein
MTLGPNWSYRIPIGPAPDPEFEEFCRRHFPEEWAAKEARKPLREVLLDEAGEVVATREVPRPTPEPPRRSLLERLFHGNEQLPEAGFY